jgi:hypothetical protein
MGGEMNSIFLSASVPVAGRGNYFETADPFLIQMAVREFVTLVLGRRLIVWGGHPAITPMIWAVCEDLGVDYSKSVVLYQSMYFEGQFPVENSLFENVIYTRAVPGDISESLLEMRRTMLSRPDLEAAVFIGGMNGIEDEYRIFSEFHPGSKVLPIASPGGAALQLAERLEMYPRERLSDVDYASIFFRELGIRPDEIRS